MRFQFTVLSLLIVEFAHGQPAPRPGFEAFEVATIKPAGPEDEKAGRYIRMQSAHRFQVENYTVNGLIAAAYDLNPKAVSGAPPWVNSDRYEIIAATPGELRPTYDEQMVMLRKLLTDRFNLSFHREKKEFAIYELTVARGGAKLVETKSQPDEPSNVTSTVYPADGGGIDHIHMPGRNVTIGQFASVLQRAILDRPVVDHTGLSGRFDFELEWIPDESQFGGTLAPGTPDTPKLGLAAVMAQQLGLRFEATRGLVETIVVEHVERPSAN